MPSDSGTTGTYRGHTIQQDLPCLGCGYNLRGNRTKGTCPECGVRVEDTLAVLARPNDVAFAFRTIGRSYVGFYSALLVCLGGLLLPVMIASGASLVRLIGVWRLSFAAGLARIPILRRGLCWLALLTILDPVPLAVVLFWRFPDVSWRSESALESEWFGAAVCAWLLAILGGAWIAGLIGSKVAAMLEYERIMVQLRAQRLLLGASAIAAMLSYAAMTLIFPEPMLIGCATVVSLLGAIAIGHTMVALSHLAQAMEEEGKAISDLLQSGRRHLPDGGINDISASPPRGGSHDEMADQSD